MLKAQNIKLKTTQNGVTTESKPLQITVAVKKMQIVQTVKRGLPGLSGLEAEAPDWLLRYKTGLL